MLNATMVVVAIFSADPALRRRLEEWLRGAPCVAVAGAADDPSAVVRLIEQEHVDVVLADAPSREQLAAMRMQNGRTAFMVLLDGSDPADGIEALQAGAGAILPRTAGRDEIVAAIKAIANGTAVLPRAILAALLDGAVEETPDLNGTAGARLTPRELEVLVAMADGASNKAIARRLDISFHTAKFHVAAILAKLDADSRTEAVARAAQLGLVML
jgi:DNA-binding NarL/FixJ family response regulator